MEWKGWQFRQTVWLAHRAFRGLLLVLLMSLVGNFLENAPWGDKLDESSPLWILHCFIDEHVLPVGRHTKHSNVSHHEKQNSIIIVR